MSFFLCVFELSAAAAAPDPECLLCNGDVGDPVAVERREDADTSDDVGDV